MIPRMFKTVDDFRTCADQGIALIMEDENNLAPDEKNQELLRDLLAVFMTATISMDQASFEQPDPDMETKLTTVRMILLSAYNLGKRSNG